MNVQTELWNAFNDIKFDEESHTYTDSKGTNYTSATKWKNRFLPKIDWVAIAKESAEKTGEDYRDVQKRWKQAGDYASTLGTEVHLFMENLWLKKNYKFNNSLDKKFPEMRSDFEFRKERCIKIFNSLKNCVVPIATELVINDSEFGICGTVDFLGYNQNTKEFYIFDWKTSKKFETESFFSKELLEPFTHLRNVNTVEYSLQLSLYKYIIEKHTNIKISKLTLFQIPNKDSCFSSVHECLDLSNDIKRYLENNS